jgi:hypothetical protein
MTYMYKYMSNGDHFVQKITKNTLVPVELMIFGWDLSKVYPTRI